MVSVQARRDGARWVCDVAVDEDGEHSRHTVTVTQADLQRWAGGSDVTELVSRSFEFLLARERPAAILRRFDLSAIPRFFPEFDREFGGK